ncbi:uroporphyrinogen decarboxylase family protein [Alistipes sp.]|uniref:uroporphyrinogen decarboxylase family protein n=1 Tax=Alistipes sp. TaxID=1872444 RepID=UPI0025C2134E|nr:uroporphyrinogen decarboxylase family protein [Alistipes sp.]
MNKDFLSTPKIQDGRIPFHPILMQFAAHMIGKTYEEFMTDHRILVDSNMRCIERFDMDAVSVISDPYRETSGFGAEITFNGDASPKAERLIQSPEAIAGLRVPAVESSRRMMDRIDGVLLYRERLGRNFPVVGWIEGPLAEACDLMGVSEVLMQMMLDPEPVRELMDKCLELGIAFADAQIRAGANIIGVGDAICSQISPEMYETFVLPLHDKLFRHIHDRGAKIKLHICGNITYILPLIARVHPDILDIDWMVSLGEARKIMGDNTLLSGNADPVAMIQDGTEEQIREHFEASLAVCDREHFIYSAGCEITPGTDPSKLEFMRKLTLKP